MLLPLAMIGVLFVMIVPVPAIILDMGLATSISMTLVLLVISLNARGALDVSAFPSVLLLLTLFRLALNVATTRLILLEGAGGKIVEAFGRVVIGGNLVVDMRRVYQLGQRIIGMRASSQEARDTFWGMVADSLITPVIDSTYPLERVAEAHRRIESGENIGRPVITVSTI
ncbi:MAG: FHIPEP family type III secretion protein [Actinomycetes bacterium]